MKKSDIGVIAVLYLIGFAFLAMTLQLPEGAKSYPLFLTTLLLGLITLYTILQILRYLKTRTVENDLKKHFSGFQAKQFFGVCAACIAYLVLIYWLGYYLSSALFLVGCMLFLKVKPLFVAGALIVLMGIIYGVFTIFLHVPLPAGQIFG